MNAGTAMGVPLDSATWSSGFLPSHHQGVVSRSGEGPVLYVKNPNGMSDVDRRRMLDALGQLVKTDYDTTKDGDLLSQMSQYEMVIGCKRRYLRWPRYPMSQSSPRHVRP
jgi:Protein of unknown function (DUF1501)